MNFLDEFFKNCQNALANISRIEMDNAIRQLQNLQLSEGRLFILGVGGSAANASHAVNDFRKLCQIEAYAPTDNVSELTARTNDDGFHTVFKEYLNCSRLKKEDIVLIFSVGGGSKAAKLSENLIAAIDFAKSVKSKVIAVVGKKEGYAYLHADVAIYIPVDNIALLTPVSEAMQGFVWHAFVSDERLQKKPATWTVIDKGRAYDSIK